MLRVLPHAPPGLLALLPVLCAAPAMSAQAGQPHQPPSLGSLAIPVTAAENRAVSFSNHRSAYFYTQSHRNDHPEHAWFRGLNLAGRRVFNDYRLRVGGTLLEPAAAQVVVRPDALVRSWPGGVTATLRLFDERDVVEIEVSGTTAPAEIELRGDQLRADGSEGELHWYVSTTGSDSTAIIDHVVTGRSGGRLLIAVGPTREAARRLLGEAADSADAWTAARQARLLGLITGSHQLWTDDAQLTTALRWITLTTDELVTRQRGDGIYAGLPWFNEYWGRDSFIALPGAVLVTGHFDQARAILTSFARFQELDRASPFYGRLPNIVKPGSIDYHTTDGTPRWVIALRDYLAYTGDRSLVRELFPNVAASIEGSLARWTDASGYLLHADNETWMDARRNPDLVSYSPRATRANDIQALWYQQLEAGVEFARIVGDSAAAARWEAAAARVRAAFARDFLDARGARIADRLDAHDSADFTLRPNLFFTLDLVDDGELAARITRRAWEALVYPWGVATLDQDHPFFHPYHLAWEHYHKDEAYHNGAVWPWLNGVAIQRMVERGQSAPAWTLFQNMNALALRRGVVGGLPENLDAYPHPGAAEPRLTGTFLQAWSNSEQLRVWYQYFLGIRPDLLRGEIVLAPRLPPELTGEVNLRVGEGSLRASFGPAPGGRRYAYVLAGVAATLSLDLPGYEPARFPAARGDTLTALLGGDALRVRLLAADGRVKADTLLRPSAARSEQQRRLDAILLGAHFAAPRDPASHPVMRQVYQGPR